jgi:hypothetical protein
LEYAVRLAKADLLELVIVAVLTPTYKPDKLATWGISLTPGVEEEVRLLAKTYDIQYICELREGRVPDEILKAAEEQGASDHRHARHPLALVPAIERSEG